MSDATKAAEGTAAPETTTPPAATEVKDKPANVGDPDWLNDRLDRAKKSRDAETLKALGVDSFDAAKAAIAKAKQLEEASKSEIEKFAEKVKSLEPAAKKAAELEAKIAKYADAELAKLTDEQKAAVAAIVGDDKARALDTIEALRPTWAAKPAEKADATKALPPPAKTTASGAPPAASTTTNVDHKAIYERLKTEHPMKAAQYALQHATEIYK
jgi:hypothetical protein